MALCNKKALQRTHERTNESFSRRGVCDVIVVIVVVVVLVQCV